MSKSRLRIASKVNEKKFRKRMYFSIVGWHLFQEGVQNTAGETAGPINQNQLDMENEGEVQPEVLDMRFPSKGLEKQITYIVLFPIIFPLWLTLPDTRGERGKFNFCVAMNCRSKNFQGGANGGQGGESHEINDENQPLDLSWPDSCRERITYIIFLPLIIPMWLTLPDTRKASGST